MEEINQRGSVNICNCFCFSVFWVVTYWAISPHYLNCPSLVLLYFSRFSYYVCLVVIFDLLPFFSPPWADAFCPGETKRKGRRDNCLPVWLVSLTWRQWSWVESAVEFGKVLEKHLQVATCWKLSTCFSALKLKMNWNEEIKFCFIMWWGQLKLSY